MAKKDEQEKSLEYIRWINFNDFSIKKFKNRWFYKNLLFSFV